MGGPEAGGQIERIRALAERVAASRGLDVFDVQFRREARGWTLRIVLDRPGAPVHAGRAGGAGDADGVTIDDCQFVSREVGTLLDVEDLIGRRYTLEVSSPGLDRPLRGPDDYRRFAGCLAKFVLAGPVDGQTHVEGRLQGMDGDEVLVAAGTGAVRRIPSGRIARARLEVEF
ncbi:MAG TPA: ribosome maturation factor RimP [Vicinamibacterales bacterium]|nr:ribosome maturation factor RimP [Vicinamibacterales bacterium]HPW20634.1 ribosome maturation factor RimP [Vicinamibacterales bacterium]